MRHIRYKGLPCIDGYFYRSDVDKLVYFHSTDPKDAHLSDELITTDASYDIFSWRRFDDIYFETRDTNYSVESGQLEHLRKLLQEAIDTKSVERFFYPHGVKAGTQGYVRWRATLYAYNVAVDELWQRHTKSGELDASWLEVLAYASFAKETSPEYRLAGLPGQGAALMRQILEAKTPNELERIRGLIGPYTSPPQRREMTYEEQQNLRVQRQIAANW